MQKKIAYSALLAFLMLAPAAYAQLDQLFNKIFERVLITDFQTSGTGVHANHFIPAATYASNQLTPALNSMISRNLSSLPLPATSAGVTFDFSSGQILQISQSLGPIFAETAQTLGKGRFNMGLNYTYMNLAKLRGVRTEDIRFTFTHEDVNQPGLGDNPNESDLVDLALGLDVSAHTFAAFGTYGLASNLDVGVLIPFINISLNGETKAVIESFTFASSGNANHRFNNDPLDPDLDDNVPYESIATPQSATGLGDVGLRLKYSFLRGRTVESAALLDIRLPTGDEHDFLGTGKATAKLTWILSKKIGDFSPHFNLGYGRRSANLDSDQLELTLGFSQKVVKGMNFAAAFIGQFDLNKSEVPTFFPAGTQVIHQEVQNQTTGGTAQYDKVVDLSNIPERNNDNTAIASFGFRAAPSDRVMFLGNVLLSLNDGGLRSNVAPTIGATLSF